MERIKCILLGGGIGCIDLLVIGKAIQQFGKDHPCTEQCKNMVKWSALVALGVIAGTVLALCFPECEIAMAAAEGGIADGVVGGVFEELAICATEGILEEAALAAGEAVLEEAAVTAGEAVLDVGHESIFLAAEEQSASHLVYRSVTREGVVQYVGRTSNFAQRAAAHWRERRLIIERIPGLENLTLEEARAVEQALIERHGLARSSGSLLNKINSIAQSNPLFDDAIQRGLEILRSVGYP